MKLIFLLGTLATFCQASTLTSVTCQLGPNTQDTTSECRLETPIALSTAQAVFFSPLAGSFFAQTARLPDRYPLGSQEWFDDINALAGGRTTSSGSLSTSLLTDGLTGVGTISFAVAIYHSTSIPFLSGLQKFYLSVGDFEFGSKTLGGNWSGLQSRSGAITLGQPLKIEVSANLETTIGGSQENSYVDYWYSIINLALTDAEGNSLPIIFESDVPEPSTFALVLPAIAALAWRRKVSR